MIMTVPMIANELEVSEETVRKWIRSGELKAAEGKHRAKYEILESDFEKFVDSRYRYTLVRSAKKVDEREKILKRRLREAVADISEIESDLEKQKAFTFSTFQGRRVQEIQDRLNEVKKSLADISQEIHVQ